MIACLTFLLSLNNQLCFWLWLCLNTFLLVPDSHPSSPQLCCLLILKAGQFHLLPSIKWWHLWHHLINNSRKSNISAEKWNLELVLGQKNGNIMHCIELPFLRHNATSICFLLWREGKCCSVKYSRGHVPHKHLSLIVMKRLMLPCEKGVYQ